MLKLKQLVLKNVATVCGDRYMVDILKINDETDCGGLLGVTDITTQSLMSIGIGSTSISR